MQDTVQANPNPTTALFQWAPDHCAKENQVSALWSLYS